MFDSVILVGSSLAPGLCGASAGAVLVVPLCSVPFPALWKEVQASPVAWQDREATAASTAF